MAQKQSRMRQVMDWSAALWAGVIAGVVFLILQMILVRAVLGGSPLLVIRWNAGILLGEDIIPAAVELSAGAFLVGILIHFALSIAFTLLLAFIIHRYGLIVGIVGGAVFGLALYTVNYLTLTTFFPWFGVMSNWIMIVAHIVFGAVAGGAYEALEVEEFELVEA